MRIPPDISPSAEAALQAAYESRSYCPRYLLQRCREELEELRDEEPWERVGVLRILENMLTEELQRTRDELMAHLLAEADENGSIRMRHFKRALRDYVAADPLLTSHV